MVLPVLEGPFTVDAYQRLGELGLLRHDDRVELIAGQVVRMTPIGDRHASCVRRLNRLLSAALLDVGIVDVQNPVVLGRQDAPQPDLTVLRPRADAYPRHPRAPDILLVIEVADSSLDYDRDVKIPLYARAGVPEAWLVDLVAERIVVYREPRAGTYTQVQSAVRGDALRPLPVPEATLAVSDILG
ncbi:MAG: Uma2 family endonuclease [Gemmatimonadales bacterium]